MVNNIRMIEALEKEMKLGWPNGVDHLHRAIPMLLQRIQDLENSLVPFARVWVAENSNFKANDDSLAHVYLKHCKRAFDLIDVQQSNTPKQDNFFSMPAE